MSATDELHLNLMLQPQNPTEEQEQLLASVPPLVRSPSASGIVMVESELQVQVRMELARNKLLEMKECGRFNVDSCISIKDIWCNWNWIEQNGIGHWDPEFAFLLMEMTANCIFGGGWAKLPDAIKSELIKFIDDEAKCFCITELDKNVIRFRRMCQGLLYIQEDVWFPPYLEKIYNSAELGDGIDMEAVNAMWNCEDKMFLKVRIEKLCQANEIMKALALVKGSILKFQHYNNDVVSEELDEMDIGMTRNDFYEFSTVYVLFKVKLEQDLTHVLSLFSPPVRDLITVRLLEDVNSSRVAGKWKKGWKYKIDAAQEWIETILTEMVTKEIPPMASEEFQNYSLSCILTAAAKWLSVTQKLNQERLEIDDISSNIHLFNLSPAAEQQLTEDDRRLLYTVPVEMIDDLCTKSKRKSYLFSFAAALEVVFNLRPGIHSKCIQLCLAALLHDVNELESLKQKGSSKEEISAKERDICIEYTELAKYVERDPDTCFEVALAGFSLNPSFDLLTKLQKIAEQRSFQQIGNNSEATENWRNVVWEYISSSKKAAVFGIPEMSFDTLISVTTNSRLSNFNTIRPSWSFYEPLCSKHLETRGADILDHGSLELARPDYSKFDYTEENHIEDATIFEAGFEPAENDSDDEIPGKKLQLKEPPSRLRAWRSGQTLLKVLKKREENRKNKDVPRGRKRLRPVGPDVERIASSRRRYIRNRTNQLRPRREPTVFRSTQRESSVVLSTAPEEGFLEEFEQYTSASRTIDIYSLLQNVKEGQNIKLSVTELTQRLISKGQVSVPSQEEVASQTPSELTNRSRTQLKRARHSETTRRTSLNSQKKFEQHSIHNFSQKDFLFHLVGKKHETSMQRSEKKPIVGSVPLFHNLLRNLKFVKQKPMLTNHEIDEMGPTLSPSEMPNVVKEEKSRHKKNARDFNGEDVKQFMKEMVKVSTSQFPPSDMESDSEILEMKRAKYDVQANDDVADDSYDSQADVLDDDCEMIKKIIEKQYQEENEKSKDSIGETNQTEANPIPGPREETGLSLTGTRMTDLVDFEARVETPSSSKLIEVDVNDCQQDVMQNCQPILEEKSTEKSESNEATIMLPACTKESIIREGSEDVGNNLVLEDHPATDEKETEKEAINPDSESKITVDSKLVENEDEDAVLEELNEPNGTFDEKEEGPLSCTQGQEYEQIRAENGIEENDCNIRLQGNVASESAYAVENQCFPAPESNASMLEGPAEQQLKSPPPSNSEVIEEHSTPTSGSSYNVALISFNNADSENDDEQTSTILDVDPLQLNNLEETCAVVEIDLTSDTEGPPTPEDNGLRHQQSHEEIQIVPLPLPIFPAAESTFVADSIVFDEDEVDQIEKEIESEHENGHTQHIQNERSRIDLELNATEMKKPSPSKIAPGLFPNLKCFVSVTRLKVSLKKVCEDEDIINRENIDRIPAQPHAATIDKELEPSPTPIKNPDLTQLEEEEEQSAPVEDVQENNTLIVEPLLPSPVPIKNCDDLPLEKEVEVHKEVQESSASASDNNSQLSSPAECPVLEPTMGYFLNGREHESPPSCTDASEESPPPPLLECYLH